MKRLILVTVVLMLAASPAVAGGKTEAQERQDFAKYLGYVQALDAPSRHTAIEGMKAFGPWIEDELLRRLSSCEIQERMAFMVVLYDRRCRKALEPAMKMLPAALERLREAHLAALRINDLRAERNRAQKAGNLGEVERLNGAMEAERTKIQYYDVQRGDEVSLLCSFISDFGREDALKQVVDVAIASSQDDAAAKGEQSRFTRTHRDKLLPGGTEVWNVVYGPVWEALRNLAKRSLDLKVIAAQRKKLEDHFDKLEKAPGIGPNQQAAIENYHAVRASMIKVEKKTKGEDINEPGDQDENNDGGGDDVKIIQG